MRYGHWWEREEQDGVYEIPNLADSLGGKENTKRWLNGKTWNSEEVQSVKSNAGWEGEEALNRGVNRGIWGTKEAVRLTWRLTQGDRIKRTERKTSKRSIRGGKWCVYRRGWGVVAFMGIGRMGTGGGVINRVKSQGVCRTSWDKKREKQRNERSFQ